MDEANIKALYEYVARPLLPHLSFAVEPGVVLEQEVGHLGVAIVTGHVERSVAHLQQQQKNMGKIVTGAAYKVNYL